MVIDNEHLGYFCIQIDDRGIIQNLIYLGKRRIPIENLKTLYGRHEKYFNRLLARYDEGVVSDFVSFFEEPWALCLFHDRFPDFLEALETENLGSNKSEDIQLLLDELSINQDHANIDALYEKFDKSNERSKWDQAVFKFLLETEVFKTFP